MHEHSSTDVDVQCIADFRVFPSQGGFVKSIMEFNPEYLASLQEQRHGVGGGGAGSGQVAGSRRSKCHDDDEGSDHHGSGVRGANGRQLALVQAGIQYHNGPVGPVTGTALNVYVIWYGNWQSTTFNTSTANPVAIITVSRPPAQQRRWR